ncbi:MAG: S1C family serine protease [Methyloligellaceae bacterium]
MQPQPQDYDFELDEALASVVGIRSIVPEDGFTAGILGTERSGNGVLINDKGVVLTIGYLITEAETIWITLHDRNAVQGHVIAYDQETGFGLVQALTRLDLPSLPLGNSQEAEIGDSVIVGGVGGRHQAVAANIVSKEEFAGYWEYLLDEAIFTAPGHQNWGGTAVIGASGDLLGIGSLQIQQGPENASGQDYNMIVPIDLLKPILDDMMSFGRPQRPPRPWLGVYATEFGKHIVIAGLASHGPALGAGVDSGDIVTAVDGAEVNTLASFYRRVWALGEAGVDVPLSINRDGRSFELYLQSIDRNQLLKSPILH